MFAIGKLLNFADKLKIFITQMVNLKEMGEGKKMSKRSGNLVSLKWLIDEVGLDAARFFYLSKSLNTHMDFDVALAKEQSKKNPVYYVQYSYARSHQIFAKAGVDLKDVISSADLSLLKEPSEFDLIKKLSEWPEIIELVTEGEKKSGNYDIHKICTYATELSAVFHKFYEKNKVLVDENDLKMARLALVRGYQIVLKDVLDVLGISAPEKM
jgi:arginyl-tRNA synthetase